MTDRLEHSSVTAFWDSRHIRLGPLASGGDRGLTEYENQAFYYTRLGQLLSIIGPNSEPSIPLEVLDAGCGRGFFSERVSRCGHEVVAFDPSPTALASVPKPRFASYYEASIEAFTTDRQFDFVYSIDVLFHILDETEWMRSIEKLATLTRYPGQLIITDHDHPDRLELGDYIVHRAPGAYAAVLEPMGFSRSSIVPYRSTTNPVCFHVFTNYE